MSEDPKEKNNNIITLLDGKTFNFKTWLTSGLRRMTYRYAPRNEALKLGRVDRGLYKCAMCEGVFHNKDVKIDHTVPVIPYTGFPMHPVTGGPDWTIFIERLFCPTDGFQLLCNPCHDQKTMIEDTMRAQHTQDIKEKERLLKKEAKRIAKNNKT